MLYDAADEAFDEIGDPRFGEGSGADLDADSDEYQFRDTIFKAASIDGEKDTTASVKRKLKAVHKRLYPKGPPKAVEPEPEEEEEIEQGYRPPARTALEKTLAAKSRLPNGKPRLTAEDFENGVVAKPTPRTRKEPPSKNKAVRAVAQQMREMGMGDDFGEGDEEASLRD